MGTKDDSTPVQSALAAFAAAQDGRAASCREEAPHESGTGRDRGLVAVVVAVTVAGLIGSAAASMRIAGGSRPVTRGCAPITYTVRGAAPLDASREFTVAASEIHRRTGFVFVPAPATTAKLTVDWARTVPDADPQASQNAGPRRVLGYGSGTWRSASGHINLVAGTITVDSTRTWSYGLDRGDSLAAVFVHELGHLLGLRHNPKPTSFMHPSVQGMRPQWTTSETVALAGVAHKAGCTPPRQESPTRR